MGYTRYDASDWGSYATSTSTMTHHDYAARSLATQLDPTKFGFRECVASVANPNPTPIMVAVDVSGSMGILAESIRRGTGDIVFPELLKRASTLAPGADARRTTGSFVSDPSLMCLAVGDFQYDRAPIQATQFENDPVTLGKQIEALYLEGGGGGNAHESYLGPWYLAAMRTRCDAFSSPKSPRKGFIFTLGDEEPQMVLRTTEVKRFFGDDIARDLSASELLGIVRRNWEVFHLMVEEGSHFRSYGSQVTEKWRALLGQNALRLTDHTKAAEVIVSAIEAVAGRDADAIVKSWSGKTALVVRDAIGGLTKRGGAGGLLEGPRKL